MNERLDGRPPIESIFGTLPDWVMKEYIKKGIIGIDPLPTDWEENLGSVTIDFHMGSRILVPKKEDHYIVDIAKGVKDSHYETVDLEKEEMFPMIPGQFIIVPTKETLTLPQDVIGRLEGRSSLARIGLVVHLTAGRFDPGWNNPPVLELKNNAQVPILIYEGFSICSFSFERLMSPVEKAYALDDRYADGTIRSKIGGNKNYR